MLSYWTFRTWESVLTTSSFDKTTKTGRSCKPNMETAFTFNSYFLQAKFLCFTDISIQGNRLVRCIQPLNWIVTKRCTLNHNRPLNQFLSTYKQILNNGCRQGDCPPLPFYQEPQFKGCSKAVNRTCTKGLDCSALIWGINIPNTPDI